jgi:hypothetical protein
VYWIAAVALVVFGVLGGFSIGGPFLILGMAMLVLGPVRQRPRLFWPVIAGVVAFNVGYWAVTPMVCTTTAHLGEEASTVCTNLLGHPLRGRRRLQPLPRAGPVRRPGCGGHRGGSDLDPSHA